jgi:hypothetical protein
VSADAAVAAWSPQEGGQQFVGCRAPTRPFRQNESVISAGCTRRKSAELPALVAATAAVLTLTACTPAVDGITGITRDAQGRLVGLWQGCKEKPTAAGLIQDEYTSGSVRVGMWVPRAPAQQGSFSLQPAPAPQGWSTWQPGPQTIAPGHVYTLTSWVKLNELNARAVEFTSEDVAELAPGDVLISHREAADRVISRDEFDRGGCTYSGA